MREARVSTLPRCPKREVQDPRPALPQWLNAELKTRVPIREELCVLVITTLITGSSAAHIMRKVNPIIEGF